MPISKKMLSQFERDLYKAKKIEILTETITLCKCFGKPTESLEKDLIKCLKK